MCSCRLAPAPAVGATWFKWLSTHICIWHYHLHAPCGLVTRQIRPVTIRVRNGGSKLPIKRSTPKQDHWVGECGCTTLAHQNHRAEGPQLRLYNISAYVSGPPRACTSQRQAPRPQRAGRRLHQHKQSPCPLKPKKATSDDSCRVRHVAPTSDDSCRVRYVGSAKPK